MVTSSGKQQNLGVLSILSVRDLQHMRYAVSFVLGRTVFVLLAPEIDQSFNN